jgi:hypothetical protein
LQDEQSVAPVAFFSNRHEQGFSGRARVTAPPSAVRETCMAHSGTSPLCAYTSIRLTPLGSALLPESVVSLLLAPAAPSRTSVAVDASARDVMLRLRTTL